MATQQRTPARPAAKPAARPAAPARPAAKPTQQAARPAAKPAPAPQQQQAKPANAVVPAQSREVTTPVGGAVDVPDYINRQEKRGSENVGTDDLVIPRIELAQALSPCIDEAKAEYIEGCKQGDLYNSLTRELYGSSVIVCPVFFKKQYLAWRDRKQGGGFGGAHDSMEEALARINEQEVPEQWEAIETAQQLVLVVNMETGELTEAVVSMARTKMKVSRAWNSLIRVGGFDRFSRLYELFSLDEQNSVNQDYKNFGVRVHSWAPVEVYKRAESLYKQIASGERVVKIDDKYEDYPVGEEAGAPGDTSGTPPEF